MSGWALLIGGNLSSTIWPSKPQVAPDSRCHDLVRSVTELLRWIMFLSLPRLNFHKPESVFRGLRLCSRISSWRSRGQQLTYFWILTLAHRTWICDRSLFCCTTINKCQCFLLPLCLLLCYLIMACPCQCAIWLCSAWAVLRQVAPSTGCGSSSTGRYQRSTRGDHWTSLENRSSCVSAPLLDRGQHGGSVWSRRSSAHCGPWRSPTLGNLQIFSWGRTAIQVCTVPYMQWLPTIFGPLCIRKFGPLSCRVRLVKLPRQSRACPAATPSLYRFPGCQGPMWANWIFSSNQLDFSHSNFKAIFKGLGLRV